MFYSANSLSVMFLYIKRNDLFYGWGIGAIGVEDKFNSFDNFIPVKYQQDATLQDYDVKNIDIQTRRRVIAILFEDYHESL